MVLALLAAGTRSDIWSDYGISVLPLAFLSVGAATQRAADRLSSVWPIVCVVTVLGVAALPGTISHLADGTRHEFRPSFEYVASMDRGALVLTWPIAIQRAYAPDLNAQKFRFNVSQLEAALAESEQFWVIAAYTRSGMIGDNGTAEMWIEAHCRSVLKTSHDRLDYRVYRVELSRCGRPLL